MQESEKKRKRLKIRAHYLGTKENDFLFGRFIDACLNDLTPQEIEDLETLLLYPDPLLYSWCTGQQPILKKLDTPVFRKLRHFHSL